MYDPQGEKWEVGHARPGSGSGPVPAGRPSGLNLRLFSFVSGYGLVLICFLYVVYVLLYVFCLFLYVFHMFRHVFHLSINMCSYGVICF